ncbi:hypothetical protein PGT21_034342 [Puccinia graminis f. sp. tritici]|uniref:J domain-containing protein n=1 Tax=Puccinia graminis f. sp. tritici TaxID=56615 RepID=A0A5B0N0Y3_PUCGR|nr:hypothetical protein PGT21_034342 [Puccinia graminis f. sp. tritici]KAA1081790.1 hypothetical protein PGTUg99_008347 [Puccinia graminis f. sp. tritici]
MEGNRDEAKRAFKLAQSLQSTDPIKSLKFAKKACALYWSPEAAALVKTLETGEGPSTTTTQNPTATSTATNTSSTTTTKRSTQPSTPKPSSSNKNPTSEQTPPTYKPAQLELVKKVRRHKITQYYEILQLKREADESQIKSAYRKLALALHPDKNNAPGADEAFKMVSKAFQVLSDPDKRAAYDRHGADPDSRSAGVPNSSPFGGGGGGGMHFSHEDAIDPDQLFRMFFGGGGFDHPGMQFGGGPTVFQFGGGGRTTFRRAGFNRRQQQQQNPNEPEVRPASTWISLLPIILFFVVSLIQSFPSLFSSPSTPDPSFSWNPSTVYPIQRVTHTSPGVTYFVNPVEFASHPLWEQYLKANPGLSGTSETTNEEKTIEENKQTLIQDLINESRQLVEKRKANQRQYLVIPKEFKRFELEIENSWVRKLKYECQNARAHRDARRRELMGFLGIGSDWEAIKKLEAELIPACEGLKAMGYVID